jgi:glucose/arabinose dehydrogenase
MRQARRPAAKRTLDLALSMAALLSLTPRPASAQTVTLAEFATGLASPVKIASAGDDRLFVVEQGGTIRVVESDGTVLGTPFLDVSGLVEAGGEKGLLGLAFHPDYFANGYFYVNYTRRVGGQLQTRVSRFSVSGDPVTSNVANAASELNLLTVDQPFDNHNGGDLHFGPDDGLLYIGLGDGGAGGDPGDRAQDPQELLGKMLRLDVDLPAPHIPPSNPFVGDPSTLDEIFALGLRNPWRFSFDRATGDLYIADVGQSAREEANQQLAASIAASEAKNWGWRCYEGNNAFNLTGCGAPASYDFPIHDYSHASGRCSIIGGFVYRGAAFPVLDGFYFFTDLCTSELMALELDSGGAVQDVHNFGVPVPGLFPTTFGEDVSGELYVAGSGAVYRLTAPAAPGLACDAAPRDDCKGPFLPNRGMLAVRDHPNPARSRLVWRWPRGTATLVNDFGTPTVDTEHAFCVYDAGSNLVVEARVGAGGTCGSNPCWVQTPMGFRYRDRSAAQDGIRAIVLRAGDDDGEPRIVVRGRGANLEMPPGFPLAQPLTAQLVNSAGFCWEATYSDPPLNNQDGLFRDRGD